jgi:hypothetical protein
VDVKSTAEGRVGTIVWQASAEEPNGRELHQDELRRNPITGSSPYENSAKFVRPLHAWECNQEMLLTSKHVNQNGGEN